MLIRLLFLIILVIVIYHLGKSWFGQNAGKPQPMSGRNSGQIDDDMVQDPQCGIYFPRRQGIAFMEKGEQKLFCSEKCRQAYLAQQQKNDD